MARDVVVREEAVPVSIGLARDVVRGKVDGKLMGEVVTHILFELHRIAIILDCDHVGFD